MKHFCQCRSPCGPRDILFSTADAKLCLVYLLVYRLRILAIKRFVVFVTIEHFKCLEFYCFLCYFNIARTKRIDEYKWVHFVGRRDMSLACLHCASKKMPDGKDRISILEWWSSIFAAVLIEIIFLLI